LLYVSVRVVKVPPAELLLLLLMYMRVMPRVQSIHSYYRNFINALPSFHNVIALEARCVAAAEPPPVAIAPPNFSREIRLEEISFAYNRESAPALRDVSLTIPAGRITAIVGSSGAGKSTVADLVMGLFPPDSGRLTIDGTPLTPGTARAWRERIGYVANETALFHLTVRENLRWARADASDADLLDALRLAAGRRVRPGVAAGSRHRRRRARRDALAGGTSTDRARARDSAPSRIVDSRRGDQQPQLRQ